MDVLPVLRLIIWSYGYQKVLESHGLHSFRGGIFLTSQFNSMRQEKPLSALSMAFDEYCDLLLRRKDSDWANKVVSNLRLALLSQDETLLLGFIPKLGLLQLSIPTSTIDAEMQYRDCIS